MKIRNVPYKKLNEKERKIVDKFYKERLHDDESICKEHYPCNKNVESFWEAHREADTDHGRYDGWVD